MWSPLCALCVLRLFFHLCNLLFHGFDQLCELFFAFLSCLGVYVLGYAFKLTITDATNSKTYEGTYKVAKKTPDGIDYEITIDGKNGYATVAMTKYYDGTEEPTLPINLGTHSIYFYAE